MEQSLFPNLARYEAIFHQYGFNLIRALLFLVVGLIVMKYLARGLRTLLGKTPLAPATAATVINVLKAVMLLIVLITAATEAGLDTRIVFRSLLAATLAAVALIMLFRPYIPTLPFKEGNTIKTGQWLGQVKTLNSDVTAWRLAWKLATASVPGNPALAGARLCNITVMDDSGAPVPYYVTGRYTIYHRREPQTETP